MGDKCEYLGPFIKAEHDWNEDKEWVELDEFEETLETLDCFAYGSDPVFVPKHELGGHTQVEWDKIGCTEVLNMTERNPEEDIALFRRVHAKDIEKIEKAFSHIEIKWGFIEQPG